MKAQTKKNSIQGATKLPYPWIIGTLGPYPLCVLCLSPSEGSWQNGNVPQDTVIEGTFAKHAKVVSASKVGRNPICLLVDSGFIFLLMTGCSFVTEVAWSSPFSYLSTSPPTPLLALTLASGVNIFSRSFSQLALFLLQVKKHVAPTVSYPQKTIIVGV